MWYTILFIFFISLCRDLESVQGLGCITRSQDTTFDQWKPCATEKRCQCLEAGERGVFVTCKNAMLGQVPTQLPNDTVSMDLGDNVIETIGQKSFSKYRRLENLNLANNKLKTIRQGAFDGLDILDCLSLMNNSIRYNEEGFMNGSFRALENLREINIQQHFTDVGFQYEDYLFPAFTDLHQLETLYLDGIPNRRLGNVFQGLRHLKSIIFNDQAERCHLANLEREFFPRNTSITNVTINHCDLETIQPGTFGSLKYLRYLDISYNEKLTFKSLPNILDGLSDTYIETIKLNNIHKTIGPCAMLTSEQTLGFKNLSLKELYFESNRLTSLEFGAVRNLPLSLKKISVKDNFLMQGAYIIEAFVYAQESKYIEEIILADQFQDRYIENFPWNVLSKKVAFKQKMDGIIQILGGKYDRTSSVLPTDKEGPLNKSPHIPQERTAPTNDLATERGPGPGDSDQFKRHLSKPSDITVHAHNVSNLLTEKGHMEKQSLVVKIPLSVRYFDVSNMKVRLAIFPVGIKTPNNLQKLNLSMNMYYEWNGPYIGFENLTALDLSWNACYRMESNIFTSMTNVKYLNLSNNFLDASLNADKNGTTFETQNQLEYLDLSQNNLISLPKKIFKGLSGLKSLNLSGNRLKSISVDLSNMKKLGVLDLSNNNIETIDRSLQCDLERLGNLTLNLENNPLRCDCEHTEFVKWMTDSKISFVHRDLYTCDFGKDLRYLSTAEVKKLYHDLQKICVFYTPLIVIGTASLVLFLSIVGGSMAYRYRWNLRYIYYFAKYKARGNENRRHGYEQIAADEDQHLDVNVSYADEDFQFVIEKIYTELEVNRGVRLYIRDRNAEAGEYICDNIFDAIENTKKTLIVMSKAYLRHKWCVFEMNMVGVKGYK